LVNTDFSSNSESMNSVMKLVQNYNEDCIEEIQTMIMNQSTSSLESDYDHSFKILRPSVFSQTLTLIKRSVHIVIQGNTKPYL
jgi:hypothetical protein